MYSSSSRAILSFVALFACIFQLVLGAAIAVPAEKRDVFVPPVLYPHDGTTWVVGNKHNVTWSTADAPVNITNREGIILLRKNNLITPLVLADNFDILLGRIEVTVPLVVQGDDYSIVLFGDSGNFSPNFTITGGPDLF